MTPNNPDNPDLRKFITEFFSDEELDTLCFDYFSELRQSFSPGMSTNQKAKALIGYCQRRGRMDDLCAKLERERTTEWQKQFGVSQQGQELGSDSENLRARIQAASDEFCRSLRDRDLRAAKRRLDELEALRQSSNTTSEPGSIPYQRLMSYVRGLFFDSETLRVNLREDLKSLDLTEEIAGAMVIAAPTDKETVSKIPDEAKTLYLEVPLDQLKDLPLYQAFLTTLHRLFRKSLQYWRLETLCPDNGPRPAREIDWCPFERAELECVFLTSTGEGKNAFWNGHKTYQALLESADSCTVLYGEPGSGLSAFARHALEHFTAERWFSVLIQDDISSRAIRRRMAKALLNYVGHKATRLLILPSEPLRHLLAALLVEELDGDEIEEQLEYFLATQPWMEEAVSVEQRRLWPKFGRGELELLRKEVRETSSHGKRRGDIAWFSAFILCLQRLKLKGVRLILDGSGDAARANSLRAERRCWQEAGLFVTFCLHSDEYKGLRPALRRVEAHSLSWTKRQLDEMVEHRSRKLMYPKRRPLRAWFSPLDASYDQFLTVDPATPQQIGRLWRELLAGRPDSDERKLFSAEDVRVAKAALAQQPKVVT